MSIQRIESSMLDSSATGLSGFRNRIINGDMRIDQRNAGAAVTVTNNSPFYTLDRWRFFENTDGVISVQQVTDAPTGFSNSVRATITTADNSLSADQIGIVSHRIEGNNFSDVAWGTASAQPVTLSFWVKSNVTGKFSGSLYNMNQGSVQRTYVFDYTIALSNTWEYKTIIIPGNTIGTWTSGTGATLEIIWGLGTGSDYKTTSVNQWFTGFASQSTGSVDIINTLNATWQITGVQLEAGSVATPFERRPYGTELALCQRYYQIFSNLIAEGYASGSLVRQNFPMTFPVQMRATPTRTVITAGSYSNIRSSSSSFAGLGINGLTNTYASCSMESTSTGFMSMTNQTESMSAEL